jgi:coproporphyrinogen III oxidase
MTSEANTEAVRQVLLAAQQGLCAAAERLDKGGAFKLDRWTREASGAAGLAGDGVTAVLEGGRVFERAGVAFSDKLPPAATARNPGLAGRRFRALGVSVVMHPLNPHAPTSHLNVRFFSAGDVWWFGGGFDLTPYLPYEDDVRAWHAAAASACAPIHPDFYAAARKHCDYYFWLPHRAEARGIGGIFYDDLNAGSAPISADHEAGLALMQRVVESFQNAYLAIVAQRQGQAYGERERQYQLYRRGRYVEFNLVLDRGTLFGLQSGGRTNSILMSMPPLARWSYASPDAELDARLLPYLTARRGENWVSLRTVAG